MKKYVSLLLAVLMICSLCACGTNGDPAPSKEPESNVKIEILLEQDDSMINTYSLLAVDPSAPFVDAANFGYADYGEYLFYALDGAPVSEAAIPEAEDDTRTVRLSTTTSVNDSGLLGYLLPMFEDKYGYEVEVFSAGTGKAIANAKMGNADLILVHSKAQEEAFIADGFARVIDGMEAERLSFLYNYFVLVGPSDDPAGVKDAGDVKAAFKAIADGKYKFVSRGDGSGTHTKELSLWPEELGITAEQESFADYTDWYVSSNAGMGVCLTMANEQGAYILSDKATFLTFRANDGVIEG